MTIPHMPINGAFPATIKPISSITPFTYRDGLSYLKILEMLIDYVNSQLVEDLQVNLDDIVTQLNLSLEDMANKIIENEDEYANLLDHYMGIVDDKLSSMQQDIANITAGMVPESLMINSEVRYALYNSAGTLLYHKGDPEFIGNVNLWSMTKMINALTAMQYLTESDLSQTVTVLPEDIQSGNRLQAGDVVTLENLFYLAALPSDNTAPRVIARYVTESTSIVVNEWETSLNAFLRAMNTYCYAQNFVGGRCVNVFARSYFSLNNVKDILMAIANHDVLNTIYSAKTRSINITGPNSRSYTVEHSANEMDSYNIYTSRGATKTGTGNSYGNVAFQFVKNGAVYYLVLMGSYSNRYSQANSVIDAYFRGVRMRDFSSTLGNTRRRGSGMNDTDRWDISHIFAPTLSKTDNLQSGIYLRRIGETCYLNIVDMQYNLNSPEVICSNVLTGDFTPPQRFRAPMAPELNASSLRQIDVTDVLEDLGHIVKGSPESSGVYCTISDNVVNLNIYSCQILSSSFRVVHSSISNELAGYVPLSNAIGTIAVHNSDNSAPLRVSQGGYVNTNAFGPDKIASGNVSWTVRGGHPYITVTTDGIIQFSRILPKQIISGMFTWDVNPSAYTPGPLAIEGVSMNSF